MDPRKTGLKDVDILWASPSCTSHSRARGCKPLDRKERTLPWRVLNWIKETTPKQVLVENVVEFAKWSPLFKQTGKVNFLREAATFKAFVSHIASLGYNVQWRNLCCADYGAPTSRTRFFLRASRLDMPAMRWPERTHGIPGMPWIPASSCIDWSVKGASIFSRKKPLCDNTLKRIAHGLVKYSGEELARPFLTKLYGKSMSGSIEVPMPTVTAGNGHIGLVEPVPFMTKLRGTGMTASVSDPMSTVTCSGNHFGLVEPFILGQHAGGPGDKPKTRGIGEPIPTVTTTGAISLVEPFLLKYYGTAMAASLREPMDTVTCRDRFGLVQPELCDILYRMLLARELAAGQGFPRDYKFIGNDTEVKRQIGNAVPPPMARALGRRAVMELLGIESNSLCLV
jgi:DNA (cytosine-5)-methyltransferase 1